MIFSIGQTRFTSNVARRTVYYCSQANRKCDGLKANDGHFVNGYAIGNGTWFNDEEGNIKTPNIAHTFKNGKCIFCGISENSKYNDKNQLETYAYEFIHFDNENILKHLQDRFFGGNRNMKFDVIIGNPPYQLQVNESGKGLGAIPIYNLFVQQAISLNPKYLSFIIPSRWFSGGVGLDEFRSRMLCDKNLKYIYDFTDSKECFPGVDINGGVMYFLRDNNYGGKCKFTNVTNGIKNTKIRDLNEFSIFIRRNDALSIVKKILKFKEPVLSNVGGCSPQTPYGFLSTFEGEKQKIHDDCEILTSKGWMFVENKKVEKNRESINLYKPLISKLTCEHAGTPDKNGMYRVLSRMEILKPNQICSQSYLIICPQKSMEEAKNVYNYLRTKFVRFLIQLTLVGMNMSIDNFRFVPWLDFTKTWDDKTLYLKYGLDENEIKTIETTIREMK